MNRVGKILVIIAVLAAAVATFASGAGACPGASTIPCSTPTIAEPTDND